MSDTLLSGKLIVTSAEVGKLKKQQQQQQQKQTN